MLRFGFEMNPAKLLAIVVLVSLTFGAGLDVNRAHLAAVLKNLGLLGRALLGNFVIVPILGVVIAHALALSPEIATGFLLMAIAPGVPLVLAGTRKKGGSLGLAVALAVMLPTISIVTVPLTAALVLPAGALAKLPLGQFFMTLLLFQFLPLIAGAIVAERAPALAAKIARPVQLLFFVALVVMLILLAPTFAHGIATVYGTRGIVAAAILCCLSLATGWLLGGPARDERRILGQGTMLRNIGLCALIATTNFKGTVVVAAVVSYLLVQASIGVLTSLYFVRTAKKVPA